MKLSKKFGIIVSIISNVVIVIGIFSNYDIDLLISGIIGLLAALVLKHYDFLKGLTNATEDNDDEVE